MFRCKYCAQDVVTVSAASGKREVLARDKTILHLCRSIVAAQRQSAARRNFSRETVHTVGPGSKDPHPSYQRACRYCDGLVQLVWFDGKYRPENLSGSPHYCSAKAFAITQIDCPRCGIPILKRRRRNTGRVELTEIDGTAKHVCSRKPPVRVIIRTGGPQDTSRTDVFKQAAHVVQSNSTQDDNCCPSCGNLLAGSGNDRSCMHCSI